MPLSFNFKGTLPIEWLTFIAGCTLVVFFHLADLHWLLPDAQSFLFALNCYVSPFIPTIAFFIVLMVIRERSKRHDIQKNISYFLRIFSVAVFAIFLHFNLKLWAPVINPNNYDQLYQEIDGYLFWLGDWIVAIHQWMPQKLPGVDNLYHGLFVGMFVASFTFHGIRGRVTGQIVFNAAILLLILGGLSYSVAPAFGPFVFNPSPNSEMHIAQTVMLNFHQQFIETRSASYEPAYFIAALGAMPSLHIANAVMFCLCAEREIRWLLIFYLPITFYFAIEAVALKWHYIIDLVVGIAFGWACYRLAVWMVKFTPPEH